MMNLWKLFGFKLFFQFADDDLGGGGEPEGGEPEGGVAMVDQIMNEMAGEEDPKPAGEEDPQPDPNDLTGEEDPKQNDQLADALGVDPDKEYSFKQGDQEIKVKGSDLVKGFMQEKDYTQKMQDLSTQRAEIEDIVKFVDIARGDQGMANALVGFIENAINGEGKANGDWLSQFSSFLEGKAPEPADTSDAGEELKDILSEIDPESATGKTIQHILAQNKKLEDTVNKLSQGITEKEQNQQKTQQEEAFQKEVEGAKQVLNSSLSDLMDPEKGGHKFVNDKEANLFRQQVITTLQKNPQEYKTQADFENYVKKVGEEVAADMKAVREGILADHLKNNKQPVPAAGGTVAKKGDEKPSGDNNITDRIADMLTKTSEQRESK